MTTIRAASAGERRRWIALVVVCLAQLMNALDTTVVNVALPSIQRDLHFSQANLTWVVDAYLITFGGFLLMAGRLGDLIGRKKVFLAGVLLFTAASAVCGLAQDQTVLVAARFVQGIGGAVSSSVIIAIVITEFPQPAERARAMSAYVFVAVGGGSIGLLAGGVLTQAIDWHWIFFINLPIGLLALLLGAALIEENEGIGLGKGVDVAGSILVTASLMLGVYALVKATEYGWTSAHTLGFGAGALALLAAFLALEARIANPIMPLRVLRIRSLTGSSGVRALAAIGMFASFFLGVLYLEHVRGYSAVAAGLAFLPMTVTVAVLSSGITARMVDRFGPKRPLVPGLLLSIAGLLVLSRAGEHAGYLPDMLIAFLLLGLGFGTSFMPLLTMAMADVPERDAGLASGIVNVSMWIGAAIGLAALSTIATDRTQNLTAQGDSAATALTGGYHLAFVIGAGCVAVGVLIALLVLRSPAPERALQPEREPEAQRA